MSNLSGKIYVSPAAILWSLQQCWVFPVNTSNCTVLGISCFSFSTIFFVYSFKPFPSHELPFLFSLLYPVVIRGFCFFTDLENFLPGIQIPSSDVRTRDNGPLLALGPGSDRGNKESCSLSRPVRSTYFMCERVQCEPTVVYCSLPRHRGIKIQD